MSDFGIVILIGGALFGWIFVVNRSHRVLSAWLVSLLVVPYWLGFAAGVYLPFCVVFTAVCCVSVGVKFSRPNFCDAAALAFAATALGLAATGRAAFYDAGVVLGQWLLGYWFGRRIAEGLTRDRVVVYLAHFTTVLGVLSILEFVADFHPFVEIGRGTNSYATWAWIQYRAGLPRSEWTFGHSIALGNILAMGLPFVLVRKESVRRKLLSTALVVSGVLVTFSRNSIIAVFLGIALTLVLIPDQLSHRIRKALWQSFFVEGAVALAGYLYTLRTASSEIVQSNDIRASLLSLIPTIRVTGSSGTLVTLFDGQPGYLSDAYSGGAARTVDSTLILLGLNLGWLAVGCCCLMIGYVVVRMRRREQRSAAGVAVLAQIPTVLTVAMITQYSLFFWFVLGVAATAVHAGKVTPSAHDGDSRALPDRSARVVEPAAPRGARATPSVVEAHRRHVGRFGAGHQLGERHPEGAAQPG